MKKITFLMTLFAFSFMASATVYMDETLNYTDGTLKPNWTANGTIGTWSSDFLVGGTALNYSNSGGIPYLANIGKKISCDYQSPYGSSNYYNYKSFNSTSISTGNVYLSFLYTPNGSLNTQSNAPLLLLTGTNSTTGVSVYVGKALAPNDAINFRFGTTRGSSTAADIKWSTTEFSMEDYKSSVFFIVLRYDLTNQISYLYINPVVGTTSEPTADASDATSSSSTKTSVQVIEVKTNGSTKTVYNISSIRVASTWAEAVAAKSSAPKLTAPTVGAATAVAAESFTANWTAVPNATGYSVNLYSGITLSGTFNATGQATESLFIKGLSANTTYTYKVIAKADNVTNTDSDESSASDEFTTTDGLTSINTQFNDATWGNLYTSENQPASGSYPSSHQNGFDIVNTFLYDITKYDSRGEMSQYGLRMDKQSNGGMVVLPTVKSLEQIEIHAIPGGAPRSITLKELTSGVWTTIGTYEMTSSTDYKEFIIPLSRTVNTKLRIENAGSGQVTLYEIITRTTTPALLPSPTVSDASGILATKFTANWTPVANATAYKVRVYQGSALVTTLEAAGQATSSVEVTGLEMDTEYTYKVLAVGDGFVNYADSYLSAASPLFSTGNTTSVNAAVQNVKIYVSNGNIISTMPGNIEVYGIQGKLILSAEITNSLPVQFVKGLYIVRLTASDGKVYNSKINIL